MEIEGEDGTKLFLKPRVKTVFGREAGFNSDDLKMSRRHLSLEFQPVAAGTERSDRVSFEVLGKNPIWIWRGKSVEKIRTVRKSETGEIIAGDRFCVSSQLPVWFTLTSHGKITPAKVPDGENEIGSIDNSDFDPVKDFGFLVIGKECEQYTKSKTRDIKQWEWFLEDSTNRNSDEDEDDDDEDDRDKKKRKVLSKKRRRKKGNEDGDWSEEDNELMAKTKMVISPTYSTRSKKTKKDANVGIQAKQCGKVDEEDEDETFGGFIVSDEEANLEEEEEDETSLDDDDDFDEDEE